VRDGGTAIPYDEEDPFIRAEYEETLKREGVASRMADDLFRTQVIGSGGAAVYVAKGEDVRRQEERWTNRWRNHVWYPEAFVDLLAGIIAFRRARARTEPAQSARCLYFHRYSVRSVYIMKELELPRKHGLDVEVLFVPVSSRAIQAALAVKSSSSPAAAWPTSTPMPPAPILSADGDAQYVCIQGLGKLGDQKAGKFEGQKSCDFPARRRQRFFNSLCAHALGLVPDKDVRLIQVGGEPESVLALQHKSVDAAIPIGAVFDGGHPCRSVLVSDLSQLGVPYTMHGFGVRKSYVRANRDVVVRFMRAYLEGIYVFKTNKEWR
jgi:hypothetical protein